MILLDARMPEDCKSCPVLNECTRRGIERVYRGSECMIAEIPDRLDGSEIRGFTKGLQKAKEIIGYIRADMSLHKRRFTVEEVLKVLRCAIESREKLRENPDAFVRCCKGGYEVYDGANKKSNS